jgi:hypothetical protein
MLLRVRGAVGYAPAAPGRVGVIVRARVVVGGGRFAPGLLKLALAHFLQFADALRFLGSFLPRGAGPGLDPFPVLLEKKEVRVRGGEEKVEPVNGGLGFPAFGSDRVGVDQDVLDAALLLLA